MIMQIIDFFWEYLRKEAFPSSSELALIDSSVCYFFVQGGRELYEPQPFH